MKHSIKKWLDGLVVKGFPDEFETKHLLGLYGISTPKSVRLGPQESPGSLEFSPPFVLKVCSREILHKTELKGVVMNLDQSSLFETFTEFRLRFPDTPLLIEEQIKFEGVEFIVGALIDPDFGPAVMAGAGGVLTELYKDVAFRLAPCPPDEAVRMLQELTIAPVLKGFRRFDLDCHGLADIISRTGELANELGPYFHQIDINPIVFSDDQWIALDAQLTLAKQ